MDKLLSLVELGHGLCSFGNGVLRKLTRKHQADGGLDVTRAQGVALVDAAEFASFGGDLFEGIGDEVVDNHHTLLGDAGLRVHLLENLEDVALVRFWSTTSAGRLFSDWLLSLWLFGNHC